MTATTLAEHQQDTFRVMVVKTGPSCRFTSGPKGLVEVSTWLNEIGEGEWMFAPFLRMNAAERKRGDFEYDEDGVPITAIDGPDAWTIPNGGYGYGSFDPGDAWAFTGFLVLCSDAVCTAAMLTLGDEIRQVPMDPKLEAFYRAYAGGTLPWER